MSGRGVERVDGAQHRAAEAFQAFHAHRPAPLRRRRPFAGDLHEHRRDAAGVQRALFAERSAGRRGARAGRAALGAPGSDAELLGDRRARPCAAARAARSRGRRSTAPRTASARARAGEVAEHDRRVERRPRRAGRRGAAELASCDSSRAAPASPPLPPLVETSTIVRLVSRAANTRASSSSAAVPDSSAASPRAAASRCARITIGDGAGRAGRWRDDRAQRAFAVDRLRVEAIGVHREAAAGGAAERLRARLRDVARERFVAAAARAPLREVAREALQFGVRGRAFEGVGRERRGERQRARPERERGDRKREQEGHEGRSVEAPVEHAPRP